MTGIRKVGVIGLGTMGNGIAQLCIQAGVPTIAREINSELAEKGRAAIEARLDRAVEREKIAAAERDEALGGSG